MNARDDVFHRSAAEIPSPDRSREERIAGENLRSRIFVNRKTDAARRVARRMQDLDTCVAQFDRVAVMQIRIEIDNARRLRKPYPVCLHFERAVQRQIGRMQHRPSAGSLSQRAEVADVVDVRVRVQQMRGAQIARPQPPQHLVDAVAAVHDDGFAAGLVRQDGAIAGKRTDLKGFEYHAPPYAAAPRAACRYPLVVDIQFDLAQVQARIAQIAGGSPVAPQAPGPADASFASMLSANVAQSAAAAPAGPAAMQWPVAGEITSPFGERKNPMGAGDDFHPGLDIAAEEGTPIAAACAGRVVAAGPDGGYGNLIVVDDGNGVSTRYGHCSQIFARVGDTVMPGQTIGAVGSTGHSTGPHLHFEVRVNDRPVDPAAFIAN